MAKVYIETYGCSLNQADSQAMAGLLKKAKFELVTEEEKAEVIIVNTCTVKSPTENKILRRLRELKRLKIPIVVAGCMPQAEPGHIGLLGFSQLGVFQIDRVVEVVEETLNGNTAILLARGDYDRLRIPHNSLNNVVDIIPICQGCLGEPCSYCIVKHARGNLFSYEPKAILKRVVHAVATGAKEIWLTAQDTAAYGKDIGTSLPRLLREIIGIQGDFKIRLGMGNPNHIKGFCDELIEVYKSRKMFKFLHVPVQSGNNDILKRMKRRYTVEDFNKIVKSFRTVFPNITIATDLICGFPGETSKQFRDSIELVKTLKPEVLNISRYWPRPGTPAAKYPGYSGNITKARSRQLTKVFKEVSFNNNMKWLGWSGNIIIDSKGSTWQGRNEFYKPVAVSSTDELLGKVVNVKVFDITSYDLRAKIIQKF